MSFLHKHRLVCKQNMRNKEYEERFKNNENDDLKCRVITIYL